MDHKLRVATIDDMEILIELRVAFLLDYYVDISAEDKELLVWKVRNYIEREMGNNFLAVIAEVDGRAVSCAYMSISERLANLSLRTGKVGTVLNVYTCPDFRKRGIASLVMKELLARAELLDLSYVELSATPSGREMYEKLGFAQRTFDNTEMKLTFNS